MSSESLPTVLGRALRQYCCGSTVGRFFGVAATPGRMAAAR